MRDDDRGADTVSPTIPMDTYFLTARSRLSLPLTLDYTTSLDPCLACCVTLDRSLASLQFPLNPSEQDPTTKFPSFAISPQSL